MALLLSRLSSTARVGQPTRWRLASNAIGFNLAKTLPHSHEPPVGIQVQMLQRRSIWTPFGESGVPAEEVYDDGQKGAKKDLDENSLSSFERGKLVVVRYGWAIVGTGVAAYLLSKSFMFLSGYLININFKTVGYAGFITGHLAGLATAGLAYSVSRGLYIRPERVHRETFYQVKNSLFLREAMGITVLSPMKAGIMRAYSITSGRFALDSLSRGVVWRRPTVNMVFQVYGGDKAQAVVTCEVEKLFNGKLNFNMIAADLIKKGGEDIPGSRPILIQGAAHDADADGIPDVIKNDDMRSLVQLKKSYT